MKEPAVRPLTVLVVDDEPLARETVRDLLAGDGDVELIGECGDGRSALAQIRERRPDIVFLDIELPAASGIAALAELSTGERPVVVYVTAYAQHAVRAFDLEAVDYVLKPFSDQRFAEALERAKRRVRERELSALAARLAGAHREKQPDPPAPKKRDYLDRLAVRRGDRRMLVGVEQIRWIESEDYYVRIHLDGASHLLRTSLATLEGRLDPDRFQRVHRTAIVRRDAVAEIRVLASGIRMLVLDDGSELPVARSRLREVETWLASPVRHLED
jgi:two-component system LytT family response regulator